MTLRELVFMVLDECKIHSDDSHFNEDHVSFLINKYRSFVLKKELEKENKPLSSSNFQTVCMNLMEVRDDEVPCGGAKLRTENKIPGIINECKVSIYPIDYYDSDNIIYTSRERMRYTGHNRWTDNLIYASKGPDDYIYLKSTNPQFLYLEKIRITAVFEDFIEAAQYSCTESGESILCDVLDMTLPVDNSQVPIIIELVVKELLGVKYQPKDKYNNATDDASNQAVKS